MNYPKECGYNDVCEPTGTKCFGLPCERKDGWDRTTSCLENEGEKLLQYIHMKETLLTKKKADILQEQAEIERLIFIYQKRTGQLEMSFEEKLERAR